ncbi:hypothetical protein [Streptomyces sp. NPDC059814]
MDTSVCKSREKISTCTDPQLLHRWIRRAATAGTAGEVLTEE